MNQKLNNGNYLKNLPKAVSKNIQQNKGEYLTLQNILSLMLNELLQSFYFYVNTSEHKSLSTLISKKSKEICDKYMVPTELFDYVADFALYILSGIRNLLNDRSYIDWRKSELENFGHDRKEANDSVCSRRVLDLKPNSTKKDVLNAIRKDLLTVFPKSRVRKMMKNVRFSNGHAYVSMENAIKSSYNKK